jgi:hypothetical protein
MKIGLFDRFAARRDSRRIFWLSAGVILSLLIIYPEGERLSSQPVSPTPFQWGRSTLFHTLEKEFEQTRSASQEMTAEEIETLKREGLEILNRLRASGSEVLFDELTRLEAMQFRLAARTAAHESFLPGAQEYINHIRIQLLNSARSWPIGRRDVHEAIYRVIYGGRAAIEEALIQNRSTALPSILILEQFSSNVPGTVVEGIEVHSGDILLSRGGAPTSALIARGNDFPGFFSHAALLYVDPKTKEPIVIEALIERGVVLSSLKDYLQDKKFRILLLRLRPDGPIMVNNPQAPHQAATAMIGFARQNRLSYDFAMDWQERSGFFCSEVPFHAYREMGIDLWGFKSSMSSPGLINWLSGMGVRHFTTLVPSDLEYDPRLAPVAEWRNPDSLRQDRLDNVTMDVLLEGADQGERLRAPLYRRPIARMIKGWSVLQSTFGFSPAIPEGMTAESALRVHYLSNELHPKVRGEIEIEARRFREAAGHEAPYWKMMELGRKVMERRRPAASTT